MVEFDARSFDAHELLKQYHDQGYVVVNGVLSEDAESPLNLASLRHRAEEATALTRQGAWKQRRVVGNAFPPFDKDNRDSWGVQHIMNPELDVAAAHDQDTTPALSTTFQQFYGSSALLKIASALLDCEAEKMQMELLNLLIHPSSHYFALGWHRDDIRPELDEHQEQQRLDTPTFGVQFNTALWQDDCLFIVPTSHRRLRSPAEKSANLAQPPGAVQVTDESSADLDGRWEVDPTSTLQVRLRPGQTVFYSQRILHRASYTPARKRATLHGCYGDASAQAGAAERARNVLQHGLAWMRDPAFGTSLPAQLQPMWHNLMCMDKEFSTEQLGYSLSAND